MRTVIDIDDGLLAVATAELGTATEGDTVDAALRLSAARRARAKAILDDEFFLGGLDLGDPAVMRDARR
jgi:Arc/MetJ family transcription regulator